MILGGKYLTLLIFEKISVIQYFFDIFGLADTLKSPENEFDFGYIWKMYIGGSFTKFKSEISILIHYFQFY